mgnify:FL=1
MEIRVLKYFLAVAREGNITKAAEILHITQPTLSRQLMQLEDELGAALFIRGKRKMVLTDTGMLLKRRAEEIVSLSEKTELEISNQGNDVSGEIVLACGITEATNTMGKYIKKFKEMYPDVTFNMRNGNTDFIVEAIDNGLVDIGFIIEPVDLEKLNFLRMNKLETWGILMNKDAPLASKEYITVDDLLTIPLINTARVETQNQLKKWIGSDYERLNFAAVSELSTTAAILVENDIGYAIIIEGSIENVVGSNLCFRPLYPKMTTTSLVVWKKYQSFGFTITKFIDFISKEIKEKR